MTDVSELKTAADQGRTGVFLGLANRVVVSSDDTDGEFSVVEITVEPGAGAPPHANSREVLGFYVIEGTLNFQMEEETVKASSGDFVYVPREVGHSFSNPSDRPARVLLLMTPAGLEEFFIEAGEAFPSETPDGPPPPEAIQALSQMADRYDMEILVP